MAYKIYENAEEKFVKANVLFSANDKLYFDETHTEEVPVEDAVNLFKKGLMLVVHAEDEFKRPTGIIVEGDSYSLEYGSGSGSGSVVPEPEDDETYNVLVFDGSEVKWSTLEYVARDNGCVLAPIPTASDDGSVLVAGADGSVSWKKVSSLT